MVGNQRFAPMSAADQAETFGMSSLFVAVEELNELAQVLCKYARKEFGGHPTNKSEEALREDLIEEICDAESVISMVKHLFNITKEDTDPIHAFKAQRCADRCAERGIAIKRARKEET